MPALRLKPLAGWRWFYRPLLAPSADPRRPWHHVFILEGLPLLPLRLRVPSARLPYLAGVFIRNERTASARILLFWRGAYRVFAVSLAGGRRCPGQKRVEEIRQTGERSDPVGERSEASTRSPAGSSRLPERLEPSFPPGYDVRNYLPTSSTSSTSSNVLAPALHCQE